MKKKILLEVFFVVSLFFVLSLTSIKYIHKFAYDTLKGKMTNLFNILANEL